MLRAINAAQAERVNSGLANVNHWLIFRRRNRSSRNAEAIYGDLKTNLHTHTGGGRGYDPVVSMGDARIALRDGIAPPAPDAARSDTRGCARYIPANRMRTRTLRW